MEFRFNLNDIFKDDIVEVDSTLIPPGFKGDKRMLWDTQAKVSQIVNAIGEASARAQGLNKAITTSDRLRNSEHKLYLLVDKNANNGKGAVTGMLKMGEKGLYVFDRQGQHYKVSPSCVLDFYVHESRQRSGYGKKLFEHMLQKEQTEPVKLAIDRPSDKFLGFLNKHYSLDAPIKQMNNYVVFDGFFPKNTEDSTRQQRAKETESDQCIPSGKKQSANGLQPFPSSPYGRYGAPRPPCSMGQIIHNDTAVVRNQEPTGIQSAPATNLQSNEQQAFQHSIQEPQYQVVQSTPNVHLSYQSDIPQNTPQGYPHSQSMQQNNTPQNTQNFTPKPQLSCECQGNQSQQCMGDVVLQQEGQTTPQLQNYQECRPINLNEQISLNTQHQYHPQIQGHTSQNQDLNYPIQDNPSQVQGIHSQVKGNHSQVEGNHPQVQGNQSQVQGNHSQVQGNYSHIEGGDSQVQAQRIMAMEMPHYNQTQQYSNQGYQNQTHPSQDQNIQYQSNEYGYTQQQPQNQIVYDNQIYVPQATQQNIIVQQQPANIQDSRVQTQYKEPLLPQKSESTDRNQIQMSQSLPNQGYVVQHQPHTTQSMLNQGHAVQNPSHHQPGQFVSNVQNQGHHAQHQSQPVPSNQHQNVQYQQNQGHDVQYQQNQGQNVQYQKNQNQNVQYQPNQGHVDQNIVEYTQQSSPNNVYTQQTNQTQIGLQPGVYYQPPNQVVPQQNVMEPLQSQYVPEQLHRVPKPNKNIPQSAGDAPQIFPGVPLNGMQSVSRIKNYQEPSRSVPNVPHSTVTRQNDIRCASVFPIQGGGHGTTTGQGGQKSILSMPSGGASRASRVTSGLDVNQKTKNATRMMKMNEIQPSDNHNRNYNKEFDISKGYPPHTRQETSVSEIQPTNHKVERPRSLEIQPIEGHNNKDRNGADDDLDHRDETSENPSIDHLDGVDDEILKIEKDFEKTSVSPRGSTPGSVAKSPNYSDAAGMASSGKNTPPGLTDKGYYDLKFYHNKLW